MTNTDSSDNNYSGKGNTDKLQLLKRGLAPTDQLNILVVPVYPKHKSRDLPAKKKAILDTWKMVKKYYHQASYGKLHVSVEHLDWSQLAGEADTYVTNERDENDQFMGVAPNIRYQKNYATLNRLWSESAQAAKAGGIDLNKYDILACVINLDGNVTKDKKTGDLISCPIRGFGDFSAERFTYKNAAAGLDIDVPIAKKLRLIVVDEQASWGRCAHEVGHCLLSDPFPVDSDFGEDLYPGDGVDSTAAGFDLMGHHDEAPLFSGYAMEALGFYKGESQIKEIDWKSQEAFNETFEVCAHGLQPNTKKDRYNLLKIAIADGLYYYVEVRQRSMGKVETDQIFDMNINLGTMQRKLSVEENVGGVVVTQVVTLPLVETNQEMRYITLLHNQERLTFEKYAELKDNDIVDPLLPHVLKAGKGNEGTASDPLRGIKITAVKPVHDRPLTYKVRVEWNKKQMGISAGCQPVKADGGARKGRKGQDFWIKRDSSTNESLDIWVESPPFNGDKHVWDYGYDERADRPAYGGDRPVAGVENQVWVKARHTGSGDTIGIHVYSISPPGPDMYGNWSPISFISGPVEKGKTAVFGPITWTPSTENATALTACIDPEDGEPRYDNNWAQQIVFDIDSEYTGNSAIPAKVIIPMALHNPLDVKASAHLKSKNVPGFTVDLPGTIELEAGASKTIDVLIKPTQSVNRYKAKMFRFQFDSFVTDGKTDERPVGSATAWITLKPKADISIEAKASKAKGKPLIISGRVNPTVAGKIHVMIRKSDVNTRYVPPQSTTIGHDGKFHVSFLGLEPGDYTVQAQMVYSKDAAQARSNEVLVKIK